MNVFIMFGFANNLSLTKVSTNQVEAIMVIDS